MSRGAKRNLITIYSVIGLGLFFLFVLSRIEVFSLKIGNASPLILLPAVVAAAMFLGEWPGFLLGLLTGTALDSVMVGSTCFNTLSMMLVGVGAGLLSSYLLNKNLWSAITLSLMTSTVYFILKWFFLVLLRGDDSSITYLIEYSLPSMLYTAVWIVPMYYGMKLLTGKSLEKSGVR